ncbi:MAG: histidinol-phosphate transaminase [Atopobiaceae bacterium]|nr:histidinol-phosphate transaminase [Atopobiaceae bacterium]
MMPAHLHELEPYDPKFSPCEINLSANENTHGLPTEITDELRQRLSSLELNRYPDPLATQVRERIARLYNLTCDNVLAGNGGDELLFDLFLAFAGAGRRVVLSTPTFSIYKMYATMLNCELIEVARDPETQKSNVAGLLEAAQEASLVVVCSPNNPTGELIAHETVEELLDVCSGIVVVDEAYVEFSHPNASMLPLLSKHENLVVLRTFSKAYALAGARCGYVLSNTGVIAALASVRQTYSLDSVTQALAQLVLDRHELFASSISDTVSERERLYEGLSKLTQYSPEVKLWPSEANFILVRLPQASKIRERLRDEWSILVRDFSAEAGLTNCLRITVGTHDENSRVLEALTSLVKEEA